MPARALWFHLPERTFVEITGRDRASFLHGFCTNDVKGLALGQGCEAFVTTHQAKIVAWVQISVLPDRLRLTAEPGLGAKLTAFLGRYIVSEDVELADVTGQWTTLLVTGGDAATLDRICDMPVSTLTPRQRQGVSMAGQEVQLERRAWLREDDFWLEAVPSAAARVGQALTAAGWQEGTADVYEALRIAAGIPVYGIDLDESNLPQEVNRTEQAISFIKGCYAGQETVARIRTYGHVNRLLVRLRLTGYAGPADALRGAGLMHEATEVGRVTSAAADPEAGLVRALGYVRRGAEKPGTLLAVAAATAEVLAPEGAGALQ